MVQSAIEESLELCHITTERRLMYQHGRNLIIICQGRYL